jgi:hypothetical protein
MHRLQKTATVVGLMLIAFACQNDETQNLKPLDDAALDMTLGRDNASARAADGKSFAIYKAEYLTTSESGQVGRTIYFNDKGNKRLEADFVKGASLDGTDNISYYIDENRPSNDLSVNVTSNAISRAMTTWDNVNCSDLGMFRMPFSSSITTGFVSHILGYGGSSDYAADVVHAGWLPASFFDQLAPQGSTFILAVTFTITFTDDEGNPTDIDNNKKADVAWREIYFNDAFTWRDGAHYDVETIALHESGHALSQAHFGTAFSDSGSGKLHFSPRAVMNAAYSGIQTEINQTDLAGHCSNWANW